MKELIPMNEFGVFADIHDTPRVDSRFVAQFFEKDHRHVLRDIRAIIEPKSGLSEDDYIAWADDSYSEGMKTTTEYQTETDGDAHAS